MHLLVLEAKIDGCKIRPDLVHMFQRHVWPFACSFCRCIPRFKTKNHLSYFSTGCRLQMHIPSALLLQIGARSRARFQLYDFNGRQPTEDMVAKALILAASKRGSRHSVANKMQHMAETVHWHLFGALTEFGERQNSEGLAVLKKSSVFAC